MSIDTLKRLPLFVSNQVLTAELLNNMSQYLDQQTRLATLRGIGRGIVCGLEMTVNSDQTITIKEGYGFTSEGYLIQFPKTQTFTHTESYKDPIYEMIEQAKIGKKWDFDPKTYLYDAWIPKPTTAGEQPIPISLLELKQNGTPALTSAVLDEKCVVLYLEFSFKDLHSCVTSNCNNKGWELVLDVKPLLIPKRGFSVPTVSPPPAAKIFKSIPRWYGTELGNARSIAQLMKGYRTIVQFIVPQLEESIAAIYKHCKSLLHLEAPPAIASKINITDETSVDWQTAYDFLKDIADAYNEFLKVVYPFLKRACLQENPFERHLTLGAIPDTMHYRHLFESATVLTANQSDIEQIQGYFKRLTILIEYFKPHTVPLIFISPSHTADVELGRRAVPFYYSTTDGLMEQYWQPNLLYLKEELTGFNFQSYSTPPALASDWDWHYDKNNFFRIEGHLGQKVDIVTNQLTKLKKEYNLEFDVLTLPLEKEAMPNPINDIETIRNVINNLINGVENAAEQFNNLLRTEPKLSLNCSINFLQADYSLLQVDILSYMKHLQQLFPDPAEKRQSMQSTLLDIYHNQFVQFKICSEWVCKSLPAHVEAFNYYIFIELFKVWHGLIQQLQILLNMIQEQKPTWTNLDLSDANCLRRYFIYKTQRQLATLYFGLKEMQKRNHRLSFGEFYQKHTGLEHLSGVEKGGTFVLVTDSANNVVADFALSSKIQTANCNFNVKDINCLPPLAETHVIHIKAIQEGNFYIANTEIPINLISYDCSKENKIKVILPKISKKNAIINPITINNNSNSWSYNYEISSTNTDTIIIDKFEYELQDTICELNDKGTVIIIISMPTIVNLKEISIKGEVRNPAEMLQSSSIVRLIRVRDNFILLSPPTQSDGIYNFLNVSLLIGEQYHIQASHPDYRPSDTQTITLNNNENSFGINLILKPKTKKIKGVIQRLDLKNLTEVLEAQVFVINMDIKPVKSDKNGFEIDLGNMEIPKYIAIVATHIKFGNGIYEKPIDVNDTAIDLANINVELKPGLIELDPNWGIEITNKDLNNKIFKNFNK